MDADFLAMLAGVILSLVFSYIPGLREKFDALDGTIKRLIMLGLLVVVSGGLFGLACLKIPEFASGVTCDRSGLVGLVRAFLLAMVANQGAYALTPKMQHEQPVAEDWASPL